MKTETRTKEQNKILYTLLAATGTLEEKDSLVSAFTEQRTTHSSEMTRDEADKLIHFLQEQQKNHRYERANTMRRKILSIAHQMDWKLVSGKADLDRIDNYCRKFGHAHKALNDYTIDELPLLVTQMERVLDHYLNTVLNAKC